MKNTFVYFVFCTLVFVCCQTSTPLAPTAKDQPQTAPAVTQGPADGVYVFDAQKYKEEQLKHADNMFKNVRPQNIDKVMQIFVPFQISINRGMATASFANEVIRGKVETISQSAGETRLKMIPIDETRKDEVLLLTVTGDNLVMDPGKKETDKMYYKKAGRF